MAPTTHTVVRRGRPRQVVATAVALAALTVGTAGAPSPAAPHTSAPVSGNGRTAQPTSLFPGFLLDRGRYTTIEAPQAGVQVFPTGINNRGTVVGEYVRTDVRESGLLRHPGGRITTFDIPGARGTEANQINDRGQITGTFSLDTPIVNNSARPHGYVLDHGKVTRIDFPGAHSTSVSAVDNRGLAVGVYTDAGGRRHGFRWQQGRFTTLDVPGAANTVPLDNNDRGQIVGYTSDAAGTAIRGFLWEQGRLTTIKAPGARFTDASGINNRGQIVGSTYDDPADLTGARGYLLADGAKGRFTPVTVPGAPRTVAAGINDQGQIVGLYENPATPSRQDGAARR
ncbi:hypothetical protein [Streptomyces fulvoviolaceus]|uniref:hypothetical protein n=1 Tax=Streptomyces fulvoviolaceus TaxID=285535 RepID=UPI0021BE11F7|nr:hypothetical protein [Streptomyces fulvoviolaceus]MCT9081326.1 hypothetical protein [Streptomyces fulvoviolaceus]